MITIITGGEKDLKVGPIFKKLFVSGYYKNPAWISFIPAKTKRLTQTDLRSNTRR
ncbi:MAG: hypothetical protein ACI4CC_00980 [Lachnospiraceae bacterium]